MKLCLSLYKKPLKKNIVYLLFILALWLSLSPIKVLAIDTNFFSGNDILFYNPDCIPGDTNTNNGNVGNVFDKSKLAKYEADTNEPSGANGAGWAQMKEAKDRAISLGVDESGIKKYERTEVKAMLRAEMARQYNELSDKHGSTLAQAQKTILFYQQFESSAFQLFKDGTEGKNKPLMPSYTIAGSEAALDILSLTNDKFDKGNGKNKRAAASYDIKYAIYLGVQEIVGQFNGGTPGEGDQRWHNTLGIVFQPSSPSMYWGLSGREGAWTDWDGYLRTQGVSEEEIAANKGDAEGSTPSSTSSGSSAGVDELDGYTLPAQSGTTGMEDLINEQGQLVDKAGNLLLDDKGKIQNVTFSGLAPKLSQEYRDYYITMRWKYVKWNWDGTSTNLDNVQNAWMTKGGKPKIVLVTNPTTGKSIYAAALEAGPAPWVGVDDKKNNSPQQGWINPQDGTPSTYKGLVSGFPPKAHEALGGVVTGYSYKKDGSGDQLTYQWAANQDAKPGPTDAATNTNNDECCADGASPNSSGSGDQTVIAIDPGHAGKVIDEDVPGGDGLKAHDYPNPPETTDVYDVATKLKTKLDAAGYKTIMTKSDVNDGAGLVTKSKIADDNQADLALSIHTDDGMTGGQIYEQKVGLYRSKEDGSGKVEFNDAEVAKKSEEYTQKFKTAREKSEGTAVEIKTNSFNGRPGIPPGNLAFVQLLSKVPWVYNEAGGAIDKEKYANGLFEGVTSSIGPKEHKGGSSIDPCDDSSSGAVQGDIVKTAINLAWPDKSHGKQIKPEYLEAVKKYVPSYPTDEEGLTNCNYFVATVMIASGVDPEYNTGGTGEQDAYLRQKTDKYEEVGKASTTDNLKPGDILVNGGHVYIYVGTEGGEAGNSRGASAGDWAPRPGNFYPSNSHGVFNIFRAKK